MNPLQEIAQLGWDWRENGAILTVHAGGSMYRWFVPVPVIAQAFGEEFARIGMPLPHSVGAYSVGGLWGSIKKAARKASRAAKRKVRKAVKRASQRVKKVARKGARVVARQARGAVRTAKRIAKSPRELGLTALTGGVYAVQQTPTARAAMKAGRYVPGPIGSGARAAEALTTASGQFGRGKRVNVRKLARGLAEAGAAYVPGGQYGAAAARTTSALARGQRLDTALTQEAMRHVPGGRYGRAASQVALAAARGKRIDRAVKKELLREVKRQVPTKHLRRVVPTLPDVQAARNAWQTAQQAQGAFKRASRGVRRAADAALIQAGRVNRDGIKQLAARARRGDPRAARFLAAFRRFR